MSLFYFCWMINKYSSLLLVCLLCFFASVSGQTEASREALTTKIVHYFNGKKYDSLYSLYSAQTKKTVSAPKTREFFDKFHKQQGLLKEYSFIEATSNAAKYRAVFDKGVYWMFLSYWNGEILALYFMPYDGPTPAIKN